MSKKLSIFSVFALGSLSSVSAFAAVPAVVGTTLTTVQTDGLEVINLVWPVMMAIFGAMLLMKLFKRAGSKI